MEANAIIKEIDTILNTLKKDYKLTVRAIEKELSYKEDYISQQRSKGGNPTLLKKLRKFHIQVAERAKNPAFEVLDIIKEMQAKMDIMFSAIAEIVAKNTGQSATVVREQFQKMVNDRLNKK